MHHKNADILNAIISQKRAQIERETCLLTLQQENINIVSIRNKINSASSDFFEFAEKYCEATKHRSYCTYQRVKSIVKKLREFHGDSCLPIKHINEDFIKRYEHHLAHNIGNSRNTIAISMKFISKIVSDIYKDLELNEETNPFKKLKYQFEPGRYELKPYKGAYRGADYVSAQKCSGKPVLIACDNSDISIVFCEPDGVSQRILFDVNPTIENGKVTGHKTFNAVIALQNDKGEIQWSWHLWFNTQVLGLGNQYDQKYSTGATLMDKNIGASLGTNSGVYYQWGKQEPFFENKSELAITKKWVKEYHGKGVSIDS